MICNFKHFYIVGLPYFLFGVILVLIGFSIALQATLNNGIFAGSFVGGFLLILTFIFIYLWIRADKKLMKTLEELPLPSANESPAAVVHGAHPAV